MEGYAVRAATGDDAPGWWIETPFSASYVQDIKAELPARSRAWRDELGVWWIAPGFIAEAERIARRHFDRKLEWETPAGHGRSPEADPWAVLWLRPGAPPPVVKAVYRVLAKSCHPDRAGGSETEMKAVNGAYEAILAIG